MNMLLLLVAQAATQVGEEVVTGVNEMAAEMAEPVVAEMSLWDMALKGGWIMAVLALLSIVCFYIFFERLAALRKASKDDPHFMERIRDYVHSGELKSAVNYCRMTNTPVSRMIEKGLSRIDRSATDVQAAIENAGNLEVANQQSVIFLMIQANPNFQIVQLSGN